MEENLNITEY